MNSILQQLKEDQKEQQNQQLKDYYELLASLDTTAPTAADMANLLALISALKIPPERVEQDHAEIARIRQLIIHADDITGKVTKAEETLAKLTAIYAERIANNLAMNARLESAGADNDEAQDAVQNAYKSRGELARLKDDNLPLHDAIVIKAPIATKKRRA